MKLKANYSYVFTLLEQNLRSVLSRRKLFIGMSLTMFVQDFMWFALWIIFFGSVHDLHGWQLSQMETFMGISCTAIGLLCFLMDGVRFIARKIMDGELDIYLTRPRHILPQLIFSRCGPDSLGDVAYGLTLLCLARLDVHSFILCLVTIFLVVVLLLAMTIVFQSLAFFINGGDRFADQLFDMFLCLGSIPQHTQGMAMKLILFSVLPAGFMVIVPVEMIRQQSLWLLALLAGAVGIYAVLAVGFFQLGLKRYTSATGWRI